LKNRLPVTRRKTRVFAVNEWIDPNLLGFSSACLTLSAIFIAQKTLSDMRTHNRLAVRPRLNIMVSNVDPDVFALELQNNGMGPALITEVSINLKGQKYVIRELGCWSSIIEHATGIKVRTRGMYFKDEAMIGAGQKFELVGVIRADPSIPEAVIRFLSNTTIEFRHKTIYEEPLTFRYTGLGAGQ
jgi:hypothetical protein